ncbi:MAG: KH domain-containing protein [Acidobacteriota bacterium]|nr:KH domain-containing protein [Blastocatellia bacterium]MDW8411765.1 KH domain-containing protein [Acidobacteriota bacterium]
MKELVAAMAKALVDKPDMVVVKEVDGAQTSIIELHVAEADLRHVIGKEGRTARAMRDILYAASKKLGRRYHLEIIEPKKKS